MFYKFKPVIRFLVIVFGILPKPVLRFLYYSIEPFPGVVFVLLRYLIVSNICKSVGDNVYIANYVELRFPENLVIGSNVSLQKFCYVDAIGGIEIGNNVSIAHQSSLVAFDHGWSDLSKPIRYNPFILRPIIIKDDVWIGAGVRILSGSIVESRNIVAAGSVVTKRSEQKSGILLAGIPAKEKMELN